MGHPVFKVYAVGGGLQNDTTDGIFPFLFFFLAQTYHLFIEWFVASTTKVHCFVLEPLFEVVHFPVVVLRDVGSFEHPFKLLLGAAPVRIVRFVPKLVYDVDIVAQLFQERTDSAQPWRLDASAQAQSLHEQAGRCNRIARLKHACQHVFCLDRLLLAGRLYESKCTAVLKELHCAFAHFREPVRHPFRARGDEPGDDIVSVAIAKVAAQHLLHLLHRIFVSGEVAALSLSLFRSRSHRKIWKPWGRARHAWGGADYCRWNDDMRVVARNHVRIGFRIRFRI